LFAYGRISNVTVLVSLSARPFYPTLTLAANLRLSYNRQHAYTHQNIAADVGTPIVTTSPAQTSTSGLTSITIAALISLDKDEK